MSEDASESSRIIFQRDEATELAQKQGLPYDEKSILYALVIFGVGDSEESAKSLQENAGWTHDEYEEAVKLAKKLQDLGIGAVRATVTVFEAMPEPLTGTKDLEIQAPEKKYRRTRGGNIGAEKPKSPVRSRVTGQLEEYFEADKGMAEAWLSGNDQENARRFRNMLRLSLKIDQKSVTGLLMVAPSRGGAGLNIEEAKMLGIGLGYSLIDRNSRIIRHDSVEPMVFDEYVKFLGSDGEDFAREYYGALGKLIRFARNSLGE